MELRQNDGWAGNRDSSQIGRFGGTTRVAARPPICVERALPPMVACQTLEIRKGNKSLDRKGLKDTYFRGFGRKSAGICELRNDQKRLYKRRRGKKMGVPEGPRPVMAGGRRSCMNRKGRKDSGPIVSNLWAMLSVKATPESWPNGVFKKGWCAAWGSQSPRKRQRMTFNLSLIHI